jgi:imidazolonepropionase-like amidohydrolase
VTKKLGLAILAALLVASGAEAQDALLFKNFTVIDGTGQPPIQNASVLVVGDRITMVAPGEIKAPRGATVVDGKGKFLMPGIINSHLHLPGGRSGTGFNRQLVMNYDEGVDAMHGLLYAGVTAVYDSGNFDQFIFRVRDDERAGKIQGPRLFTTGRLLTHPKGYQCCAGGIQVTDFEGTKKELDEMLAKKPDLIKFTREDRGMGAKSEDLPLIPLDVTARLIAYVHDQGFRTTIHVADEKLAREAIGAGIDALAHPVYLAVTDASFARTLAAKRIPVSTTMGRTDVKMSVFDEPLFVESMSEEERKANQTSPAYGDSPNGRFRASLAAGVSKNMKILYDNGVIMAMGTDRSMGAFVHREMEMLNEAGIPPIDVLKMATLNAAIYVGQEKDLGSIERGKLADILILNGDPSADIHNTTKIDAIYKGGKKVDRKSLNVPANRKK